MGQHLDLGLLTSRASGILIGQPELTHTQSGNQMILNSPEILQKPFLFLFICPQGAPRPPNLPILRRRVHSGYDPPSATEVRRSGRGLVLSVSRPRHLLAKWGY